MGRWLGYAAAALLAVALAWPVSRGVVAAHLGATLQFSPQEAALMRHADGLSVDRRQFRAWEASSRAAALQPGGEEIQLAAFDLSWPLKEDAAVEAPRLEQTAAMYPKSVLVRAGILRLLCFAVRIQREEEFLRDGTQPPKGSIKAPDPRFAALFDKMAREAEQLDPDNAYFTMFRVVHAFALKRDDEALKLMAEAAQKPRWEDPYDAWARGWRRLTGRPNYLGQVSIMGSLLLPELGSFRRAVRMATYFAGMAEKDGQAQRGADIRRNIMLVGRLQLSQSSLSFVSLHGSHIMGISSTFVRGSTQTKDEPSSFSKRSAEFTRHLRSINRGSDAELYLEGVKVGEAVNSLVKLPSPLNSLPMAFSAVVQWATLCVLFTLALASAIFAGATRAPHRALAVVATIGGILLVIYLGVNALVVVSNQTAILDTLAYTIREGNLHGLAGRQGVVGFAAIMFIGGLIALGLAGGLRLLFSNENRRLALSRMMTNIAVGLLIVYSAGVLAFGLVDSRRIAEFDKAMVHEGRYVAAEAGLPWPEVGPVKQIQPRSNSFDGRPRPGGAVSSR